ncbi:MAG: sensor histidine kinase [Bacteroidota bacterium]
MKNNISFQRIGLHILFWISQLTFFTLLIGNYKGEYFNMARGLLFTLPADMIVTYFYLYFIIPRFLLTRKWLKFFVAVILTTVGIALLERAINHYLMAPYLYGDLYTSNPKAYFFNLYEIFYMTFEIYTVVIFASAIKLLRHWYFTQKTKNQLEIQNKASEIALLRMQVNPHFLFNTINNIHALIGKDDDKAGDSLAKLSDIMRYMLYDTNTELVPLNNELDYLQSYIELQKLRMVSPEVIQFDVEGDPGGTLVAPMLFIPFIENAFKHYDKSNPNAKIKIHLKILKDEIQFSVLNPYSQFNSQNRDATGGIGLVNVRRRLELIYPEKHFLSISKENEMFKIEMKIITL